MELWKKHTFALLALWFMAPFMSKVDLKQEGLTKEEIEFVKGYIKAWWIVWIWLLTIGGFALLTLQRFARAWWIVNIATIGLVLFLIGFTFAILW